MSERDDMAEQMYHEPQYEGGKNFHISGTRFLGKAPTVGTAYMSFMQDQVRVFHEAMGQPAPSTIQALPEERKAVRIELIREEFEELKDALAADDLVETCDAAIDILYVVFGLLVEMGVDATPLFQEVQRSNMSKLGADGKPIIAGPDDPDGTFPGRVKKGPNYSRPDLARVLQELGE
jgi:phosphoribosyl-ATP pyrophosphohydrolase